ncbi:unnamed protein product [Cylicocyclus nassatus]|uniref:Protein kinase domain-containing protein n=1 Tax=Cylicocyclus nassatus TaxID=53992 RepID=A0AA36GQV8_CYLNA|nr:unnamed protein product [Cylicocyclus nassatus]
MRTRSSSLSKLPTRPQRAGISLDRNNNAIRLDRQPRLIHNTSKHLNEGFFGASENIYHVDSRTALEKHYEIGAMIGRGNFSRVYFALRRKDEKKCALKEVLKQQLRGKWFFIENEVEILQMCSHPNICKIVDAYKTNSKYLLVFEYAQNGDLFELIRRDGKLEESDAATFTSQTASALAYLHNRKIVHRDIKAENLLLYSKKQEFGQLGGPRKRYGLPVDIWSLGVLLHVMLVGFAPFRASERDRLFRLITQGRLYFGMPEWREISEKARELVSGMMCTNVEKRYTAGEVLLHPWIRQFDSII